MLISFTIENWMSFRNPAKFSMIASRERQHNERVPKIAKYSARILPIAAIYGGNASGKTNLFKALNFAQRLVVRGTQPKEIIPIESFCLDSERTSYPSSFSFELLIDETIYEFSFSVTKSKVIEEKLVEISSTTEKVLYHRQNEEINFDVSLDKDKYLHFAFKGTRDNQLFLTNSVSQKVKTFAPIYEWFDDSLELIAPDSRFAPFERFIDDKDPLHHKMGEMLAQFDTGITQLGSEDIPFNRLDLPDGVKAEISQHITEDSGVKLANNDDRVIIERKDENLIVKKLVTYHSKRDGENVKFDIKNESDGSRRVIDLLPAFLSISAAKSKKVYIVDELDRNLHTLLTRKLIELYLQSCSETSRAQMLFTTHDVLLMDQSLLRRDEMWVTERNRYGESGLISFNEYKDIRYDKDIRKSYLLGRMGGIPRLRTDISLMKNNIAEENL
jgi:AAA15 family ATPase/GTPase